MTLMQKYPRVRDLLPLAKRRLPPFVHAYLAAGTGAGEAVSRNEQRLAQIELLPVFLRGRVTPDLSTSLFGKTYDLPFGVSPIGLSSLIWPGAERYLARMAAKANIPYALSTVAGDSMEAIGPVAGDNGWFQLYAPNDKVIMQDLLSRARNNGFSTLVVTADVPGPSRREDMARAGAPIGSRNAMSLTPRVFWQSMTHPTWALAALQNGGKFRFKNLEPYYDASSFDNVTQFIGSQLNGSLDWDYLNEIRAAWDGPLILKGILNGQDATRAVAAGVDGLIVSNHGGRQLDAVPASIDLLEAIRSSVGPKVPLLFDSGVRSGLDIARALAAGADFVMCGRAFMYGVAALGEPGPDHVLAVLKDELENTMVQLGLERLADLPTALSRQA